MLTTIIITLIVMICGLLQTHFIFIITRVLPLQIIHPNQSLTVIYRRFFTTHYSKWYRLFLFGFFSVSKNDSYCKGVIFSLRWVNLYSLSLLSQIIGIRYYGTSFEWGVWVGISSLLMMLMIVDWNYLLLPDSLTFTLLWLGLLFPLPHVDVSMPSRVWGAVIGYLSLRSLNSIYLAIYQREGLGLGDCKLFAAIGVLLGVAALPQLLIIACVLGMGIIVWRYYTTVHDVLAPIPFGSCLSLAAMGLCSPF